MLTAKGVVIRPLTVSLKDFRSIREQVVPLGPITVVYEPNGAGKSSLLYGLAVLRNVVLGPSQAIQGFFNLRSINCQGLVGGDELIGPDAKIKVDQVAVIGRNPGPKSRRQTHALLGVPPNRLRGITQHPVKQVAGNGPKLRPVVTLLA